MSDCPIVRQDFRSNPTRAVAKGRPVFSVRVMPWADDVSGNRSKQYNPHINLYMKNLNVPSEKLKQQFFVRFCSTSPDAGSNEQFREFLENWCVQLRPHCDNLKVNASVTAAARNTFRRTIVNLNVKSCFGSSHTTYLPTTHNRQSQLPESVPTET